ncbi:transcriptional activator RfaH [Altererythrobacter sp. BO-6]|uniref:transcription termination/antitermination protein NusG n=1 Tax=Altererythrobacter sp. BO-6 TaxID=2604537 RepID=UPI0013E10329|nr:transcriptional activator RfaH [Altererythrobacter sp. BO-6]QIG54258.1 transcriptional activator RfaH [Altererythrobacter sp. BO-6]
MDLSQTTDLWYLAQVKPNSVAIAQRNLERQGFHVFCPLERITRARGGKFISATRPFFPGYLFVQVGDGAAPWREIASTLGVSRLVSFGPSPAPVPSEIVEELQRHCDDDGCMGPLTEMAEGDEIRIANGPLADFWGRIVKLGPDQRAWVLLDIMGKQTRVLVSRGDLRLAS